MGIHFAGLNGEVPKEVALEALKLRETDRTQRIESVSSLVREQRMTQSVDHFVPYNSVDQFLDQAEEQCREKTQREDELAVHRARMEEQFSVSA